MFSLGSLQRLKVKRCKNRSGANLPVSLYKKGAVKNRRLQEAVMVLFEDYAFTLVSVVFMPVVNWQ